MHQQVNPNVTCCVHAALLARHQPRGALRGVAAVSAWLGRACSRRKLRATRSGKPNAKTIDSTPAAPCSRSLRPASHAAIRLPGRAPCRGPYCTSTTREWPIDSITARPRWVNRSSSPALAKQSSNFPSSVSQAPPNRIRPRVPRRSSSTRSCSRFFVRWLLEEFARGPRRQT